MILFMSIRLSLLLLESLRNVLDPMKLILGLHNVSYDMSHI